MIRAFVSGLEPKRPAAKETASNVTRRAAALIRKNDQVLRKVRRLLDVLRVEREACQSPFLDPVKQKQARGLIETEFP